MSKLAALVSVSLLSFFLIQTPVQASEEFNLITKVNEFRKSKGLTAVKTNMQTCNFAQIRAKEAAESFTHEGFYNRISSKTLPYPRYRLVTENLAWAPKNQDAVQMWVNSPTHAANMLKNINFACIKKQGDYYAFEGLRI